MNNPRFLPFFHENYKFLSVQKRERFRQPIDWLSLHLRPLESLLPPKNISSFHAIDRRSLSQAPWNSFVANWPNSEGPRKYIFDNCLVWKPIRLIIWGLMPMKHWKLWKLHFYHPDLNLIEFSASWLNAERLIKTSCMPFNPMHS